MQTLSKHLILPDNYSTGLNIQETERAIKDIKDFFERELAKALNLSRVSAPLFVRPETGLNDNLNGIERPVSFEVLCIDNKRVEIVHSLAKWKRLALEKYQFEVHEGLYTDMNAIRRDEETDNLHSIYVDQWDWEKIILKEERHRDTLINIVKSIYSVLKETEIHICNKYSTIERFLPEKITFITTQELEDRYPDLSAKEREDAIAKEYKAVFIMNIGGALKSGKKHDGRAPDYDDWSLNGDIIFWYPLLDRSFEISSMGIRVDKEALLKQLEIANCQERVDMKFHQDIVNGILPYTIGGGIGQSRLCMFFLNKAHIGEVQASIWEDRMIEVCKEKNINLL